MPSRVFEPTPPYSITPHVEGFTLPGRPTPWLLDRGPPPRAREVEEGPWGMASELTRLQGVGPRSDLAVRRGARADARLGSLWVRGGEGAREAGPPR